MNTLWEIYLAVKEVVNTIRTAYTAGLVEVKTDTENWNIYKDNGGNIVLESGKRAIYLNLSDFGRLALDFGTIYSIFLKATEYLEGKLKETEKVKETLAPFVLGIKIG